MSLNVFLSDVLRQYAVTMAIVVIGEAATRLIREAPELALAYPNVPWQRMRNMRNRLAHSYFETDFERLWDTVKESIPRLIEQLSAIKAKDSAAP